ncbi:MAG: carbonic anhydrase [Bdellovibrionota bacterium]
MEFLYKGFCRFRDNASSDKKNHLKTLEHGQNPHSLMVTCSDSRIAIHEFTDSRPGDVFIIRNAGNMIPENHPKHQDSIALSLEYAVTALGVKEIVICGHVSCGAMIGLQSMDGLDNMPIVQEQLKKARSQFSFDVSDVSLDHLIIENVSLQMKHVMTYPFVKQRLENKQLNLWGWVYDFANVEIKHKISWTEL